MKKILFTALSALLMLASCGNNNDFPALPDPVVEEGDIIVDIYADIEVDETPLTGEVEALPKLLDENYKNFIEYFKYSEDEGAWDGSSDWNEGVKSLEITFADNSVSYVFKNKNGEKKAINTDDFQITIDGANIVVTANTKCHYFLRGTTANGSFKLYSENKCLITLDNVSITNPHGAAINLQKGSEGGKRSFIIVNEGTKNYLTDGTVDASGNYSNTPANEQEKGVIFSEGKLCFCGNGYLNVKANGKHGIVSDDYIYLHKGPQITITPAANYDGIKTNDGVYIGGGVLNIVCSGVAAKGINTDGLLAVSGGRTTVINTAKSQRVDGIENPSYCVKTDSCFNMTSGVLLLSAPQAEGNGIIVADTFKLSKGVINMKIGNNALNYAQIKRTGGSIFVNGGEY